MSHTYGGIFMKNFKGSTIGYIVTAIASTIIAIVIKDTDAALMIFFMGFGLSYCTSLNGK